MEKGGNALNILIKSKNEYLAEAITERFGDRSNHFFSAPSFSKAISVLNDNKIDKVVMELNSINEINLLEYINKYYKNIKILLIANNEIEELLTVARNGEYSVSQQPFDLNGIKDFIINKKMNFKKNRREL